MRGRSSHQPGGTHGLGLRLAASAGVEHLEPRQLLSSAFTAEEVYFAELVNRARANPQAEAARLGFSLTDGLTDEELALFGPVEPLALDISLTTAARAHSLDMATRGFFDDINPDGLNPTQRARAAGYSGVAGEDIASGQSSVDTLYEAWMSTPENRINILSLLTTFDDGFHYDQLGPGFATDLGFADDHYTAMFGDPGPGSSARLLGVVYDDLDSDGFYSVGEGAAGVKIEVAAAGDPDTVVASFTTDDAGNYQLKLGDGSWVVTFTDLATGWTVEKSATTGGQNVKVDAEAGEFGDPNGGGSGGGDGGGGSGGGGEGDDHADDGDYANATLMTLGADHAASDTGLTETGGDTDLFYFTADIGGQLDLTLDASAGELVGQVTLKSDAGLALAVEHAAGPGQSITLQWNVVADTQYFVVVGAYGAGSTGAYALGVAVSASEGGGSGGGDSGGGGTGGGGQNAQDEDPPIDATSDDTGAFTIVRRDADGNPVVYQQAPGGAWTSTDLLGRAGGPTPEGRYATFIDPGTGRASVVSATGSGLGLYGEDAGGAWSVRNLSAELDAAPIVSKPVTFKTRQGMAYIAGLDGGGNLVAYYQTGQTDGAGGYAWSFVDISAGDLASQGVTMPELAGGTLIAYVTAWNALTIAGLDADGNIYAAWWAPGRELWAMSNLSAITGAPKYQGTISAYLTPWNGINIAGTDENGDLSVVWWVPSFGGKWALSKLNQILGGPDLGEGTIASWVTPWGGLNISGLTDDGKVVVYWWTPSSGGWQITTLSDYIRDVDPPASGVIGHTSRTGVISIMGLSEGGDLVRYWWQAGQPWSGELLPPA